MIIKGKEVPSTILRSSRWSKVHETVNSTSTFAKQHVLSLRSVGFAGDPVFTEVLDLNLCGWIFY